jgi:5-methylcytosine-specific restriction endonuclease McrA
MVQLARQPYCTECGSTDDLTADHIVPLARGGPSEMSNVQILCRSCNGSKSAR